MNAPNKDQAISFIRHIVTAAGSVLATLAVLHIMTGDQAKTVADALSSIGNGVVQVMAAIGIIAPVISGLYASFAASPSAKLTSVANQVANDPAIQKIIINGDGSVQKVAS